MTLKASARVVLLTLALFTALCILPVFGQTSTFLSFGTGGGSSGGSSGVYGVVNGRLTTESAVPVSTSDRTAQSTVYFTPYNGNQIGVYDGSASWSVLTFTETSLALSGLTSGKNYDVFAYSNSGTLALELSAAWTNDSTRADAITLQDGIYVKSGATTRRFVGTIRTTGTTTTEDSAANRYVWNTYNQAQRVMRNANETADTWTYGTSTWRQANANTANQVNFVVGLAEKGVSASVIAMGQGGGAIGTQVAIGLNSTSTPTSFMTQVATGSSMHISARYDGVPVAGYNYLAWLERSDGGTSTYYGDAGAPTRIQSGITGTVWN